MRYLIFPILLLIYFELIGRWVFMKLNKDRMPFSFVVGFLAVMAVLYVISWPITAFNGSFFHLLYLYLGLFLISLILIIKDIRKLDWHINNKMFLFFLFFFILAIISTYFRTLGDPHGFDPLYYINMVSFNIENIEMNSLHPHFGTYPNTDVQWITYVFQSYYYFIAVVIYLMREVLAFIGMRFDTLPAFVWGFQIIQSAIFVAVSILSVKELKGKSKILNLALIILLCLFLGNLYYNNAFGFIGNNYRMAIHAFATIYLFCYFKGKDKSDFFLFLMSMLGMCAVSSTGTFSFVFVLFGLFFYLYDKEKNLLRYYSVFLFVPLLNILVTKVGLKWWVFVGALAFILIIYLLNDFILKIYQNKYIRYGTLFIVFLMLYAGSIYLTKQPFNIDRFFTNYSEFQDMSWDYFDFYDYKHWIFNLLVLIPMFYFLFKNPKHPFAVISWVLILTFFNPLGSNFMNKINWVYYRSYDITINHFTLAYFLYYLEENVVFTKTYNLLILLLSTILAVVQIPSYWHESFVPSKDYNPIYKIDNSELEVINNVRQMIKDRDIKNPAIITSTFYMPSFIEDSTYLIGKERRYNYDKFDDNSWNLYLIFFPTDGWDNFRPADKPDYNRVIDYLKESEYDILVVDYGLYADVEGEFISLADAVEKDGTYQRSGYSTAKYAVYDLGDKR